LIAGLAFGSALVYSPRGQSPISARSRRLRDALKRGDPQVISLVATHIAKLVQSGAFPGFFGGDVALVPVPGRAPRRGTDTLWVPERVCQALVRARLGSEVWPTIQRVAAVPKSAFAAPGERPEIQVHVTSLEVVDRLPRTSRVLLVDDFVTKGRTLLAAASVLANAFPGVEVRGFAVVRTMGLVPDIERIASPVVGEIRFERGDAERNP
jgi:predicted amidophosphoribosyltransferase